MNTNLKYVIIKPRSKINLNLFEAEKYESAVIVQQLIGTLVYYSNFGRYEPRLAKTWRKTDPFTWEFVLHEGLRCENGEIIDAKTYKKSLERTLFILKNTGGIPVFDKLIGFDKFIFANEKNKNIFELSEIEGIKAIDNKIIFQFVKPIKSGVLQLLSFSPLGYISKENLKPDGTWKSNEKFISSGPYKATKITIGEEYILNRNPNWKDYKKNAPEQIVFTHSDNVEIGENTIIDAFTNEYKNEYLSEYKLVPEYLNSVLLGNFENGYFKERQYRQVFKRRFLENTKIILPEHFSNNVRSDTFYANQKPKSEFEWAKVPIIMPTTSTPLVIEGRIPIEGTSRWYAWKVLEKTLNDLKLHYQFNNNDANFKDMTSREYDIRIRGSSIGSGVESWGLFVEFCSSFGLNFPDPNLRICDLLNDFERDLISEEELSEKFLKVVEVESAVLTVSHYGGKLFLSEGIEMTSLSPLLAIMKFDQIELK